MRDRVLRGVARAEETEDDGAHLVGEPTRRAEPGDVLAGQAVSDIRQRVARRRQRPVSEGSVEGEDVLFGAVDHVTPEEALEAI